MKNFINMKRRTFVRYTTYITSLILVLAIALSSTWQRARAAELYMENSYYYAFSELTACMEEIDHSLQKTVYATSPALMSFLCTNIYGKAEAASTALSKLPFSGIELDNISGFINKSGDYAYAISRRAASGESFTQEDRSNLKALSDTATVLAQNLSEMQSEIFNGKLTLGELEEVHSTLMSSEDIAPNTSDSFSSMENEFPELPTLIYDGPFSEHIEKKDAAMLSGLDTVSQEEALKNAVNFLDNSNANLTFSNTIESQIKAYSFISQNSDEQVYVEVSQTGGIVMRMLDFRTVNDASISAEDAVNAAKEFLAARSVDSMVETYYMATGNILTINFAYSENGVICYPDLIKVSVALDNGDIVGYDAEGFIMSHSDRSIPEVTVSEADAKSHLESSLEILSHELAIIPTAGENEVFCHEFKCKTSEDLHYIMYVNAVTGTEEQILILIESENGTLTI